MNKEQVKAQLISAKEQAETSMPSLMPCLDELLEAADGFDKMSEGAQQLFPGAFQGWLNLLQDGDPSFEEQIETFRKLILGYETRSAKDTALILYLAMYVVDFASTFSCLGDLDADKLISRIVELVKYKKSAAQCVLASFGISSPQHAVVQHGWLKKTSREKAAIAGIEFEKVEVLNDGELRWSKKND